MSGGAYTALSGMLTRIGELDRLASDLANVGTAGYKTERAARVAAERDRQRFRLALDSAVDVTDGGRRVDFRAGSLATTGRDLDMAIDGRGFFVITTPNGQRYTRNGSFTRRADGLLTTAEGEPVLGENGQIRLGPGKITADQDGTIRTGETIAGRLRVVDFDESNIDRESGARFRAMPGVKPRPATGKVMGGSLEQANVGVVDRMVALTEIKRSFEALQRGATVLMNDVDGRAINELGRRT
ncbi:MAG TPA: flagellar hook basal-body protein [Vicinamibacterales bacterium]|jgi:flagellar basal-body rod protein FlgG|nr:flagellar hook basal-body protein [Vicinamibacterales bacterium]